MNDTTQYPYLSQINETADLRELPEEALVDVSDELRQYLIASVAKTGGHFGSSLGTVELTVALHYVFNTPEDRIVWDVGHQTYPHKILTGRRDRMDSMRKKDGLAGFPKRSESPYDTFGVGHSSTSISAALGMATACKLRNEERNVIAVIGDGAMTAGMAFEALSDAGDQKANLLVILNDNDMSISPNVGALNKYFTRMVTDPIYHGAREGSKKVLRKMPPIHEFARRAEEHMKGMVVPASLFEELGFNYFGPVDGHDVETLTKVLANMKKMEGPRLLHLVTKKGKGFKAAEEDALALHAVTPFDIETGEKLSSSNATGPTYTQVFGEWLCDMGAQHPEMAAITPAMREGSGMVEFAQQYPSQYFDVAIAEQHAVTLAAGMACEGVKPVVAIYSTFMQRAYDQIAHDVDLQNLDVLFAVDRAGVVGPDGPTHAGSFDVSILRCLPNMVIMAPADEDECRQMLYTGYMYPGPAAVRYPRGTGPGVAPQQQMTAIPIGQATLKQEGENVAILAFGTMVEAAQLAADTLGATLVNMRFIKPLDTTLIDKLAKEHTTLITIEESAVAGGAGSGINEYCLAQGLDVTLHNIGLPDCYLDHGSREELLEDAGLDAASLLTQIQAHLNR